MDFGRIADHSAPSRSHDSRPIRSVSILPLAHPTQAPYGLTLPTLLHHPSPGNTPGLFSLMEIFWQISRTAVLRTWIVSQVDSQLTETFHTVSQSHDDIRERCEYNFSSMTLH